MKKPMTRVEKFGPCWGDPDGEDLSHIFGECLDPPVCTDENLCMNCAAKTTRTGSAA